jgi:ABC transport system ATP-binding/permease protein
MLACRDFSVLTAAGQPLVRAVSMCFAPARLHALIGPSGCGKSTLLRGLLGVARTTGEVTLDGAAVQGSVGLAGRVGLVPQFSIAQPLLTVRENLSYARRLFAPAGAAAAAEFDRQLELIGLRPHLDKPVAQLSGGQLRRLGLALELVAAPHVLLCDEVTSGLDPSSEIEIIEVLRGLVTEGVTVVCVIHNLARLDRFDRVHVLAVGRHLFSGEPSALRAAYRLTDYTELYPRLDLHASAQITEEAAAGPTDAAIVPTRSRATDARPGGCAQLGVLLRRRTVLFMRDREHLALTAALTFGFPLLVVVFALKGLPQLHGLSLEPAGSLLDQMRSRTVLQQELLRVGSLVSGLVMFQAILLTLMGANNGAREIAGERALWEKERLAGLRPWAYAAAKALFVLALCAAQALWMTACVKLVCGFPGAWVPQAAALALCTCAMGATALAISALAANAEKASLLSTYLVGFQLPLSGVVLALPDWISGVGQPLIAAFWGWSGYLHAMQATSLYDAVGTTTQATAHGPALTLGALTAHICVALAVLGWALRRPAR